MRQKTVTKTKKVRHELEAIMIADMDREDRILDPNELAKRVPESWSKEELQGAIHVLRIIRGRTSATIENKDSKQSCRRLLAEIEETLGRAVNLYLD
jgi:predicted transcriptional regulator